MTHTDLQRPPAKRPPLSIFITILSFFALVVLLTGTAITAANYIQTRQAAKSVATTALDAAIHRISDQLYAFFGSVNLFVDLYANNPRVISDSRQIESILVPVMRGLRRTPQIAGIYGGYENGEFWELFSFSDRDKAVVATIGGPPGTRFALQTIRHSDDGVRREFWRFFGDDQQEMSAGFRASPTYDPRERAWYKAARARPADFIRTAPYIFAVAARRGLTVAKSFDGPIGGAVGVDVTLGSLSSFLETVQPNPRHRVLAFGEDGDLLAAPDPNQVSKSGPGSPQPAKITDLNDPVVQAVAAKVASAGAFEMESIDVGGQEFLASVVRLQEPDQSGGSDYILYAAPRSEFEGTLAGATQRSILAGLLILLLASPAVIYLTRRVATPLTDLSNEATLIQAIIDTIPIPIFYKGPDTRFLGCNGAYEACFNTTRGEIIGKRASDLNFLPESERLIFQGENEEVIREGGSLRRERDIAFADGQIHHTLYYVTGFRQRDGQPGGLVGTLVDISELKNAQRAMAEAKEVAEAATKTKSEFLASMSHEIRTPMNGVTGMADLLAQTELNDEQKHMLRTIRESGNALITVINDILDFSKIEAGKLGLEAVSMSIADAVEGVAGTLAPNAAGKGVHIHVFVDPEIPSAVMGDPVRLRQILFNLAGNAVKFSDKKDVSLRATRLRTADDGRCWVRYDVIDRGIGISEENQAKLFKAFSQAESSTTRRFGGTGLGLAICRRLVDLMGGNIGVESSVGYGSTFYAELPYVLADTARGHERPRDLQGLRVMVVGSPAPREETLGVYLGHWGAKVTFANDEQEAEAALREAPRGSAPFDAVILDFGFDQTRQSKAVDVIRSVQGCVKMPLVVFQDSQKRAARMRGPEIIAVNAAPLVRFRLISAVAVAAGRASPDVEYDEDAAKIVAVAAPTVEEAAAQGRLILVAEDNATNQDVIRRQLNRVGYACEIAANGAEALKAWHRGRYGLLLTDCHMPEMDGYELTENIRAAERNSGRRMPIIAITASALQGEIERCLAAGMDGYLSKPLAMPALIAALKKWLPLSADLRSHESVRIGPDSFPSDKAESEAKDTFIDERVIKNLFGDDDITFKEVLESFVEPSEAIMHAIAAALQGRDAEEIRDAAHKLKSSARTVGANALADTCAALETAGDDADWDSIEQLAPRADALMKGVLGYIKTL